MSIARHPLIMFGTKPAVGGDTDAAAFISAASITDPTQQTAINTLVVDLKAAGLWAKCIALYPFVGGTATAHKLNLKNPADTDAAFRLELNGGFTHSANGILPNGTNGYARTFISRLNNLALSDVHLSFYSRTSTVPAGNTPMAEFLVIEGNSRLGLHAGRNYDGTNNRAASDIASTSLIGAAIQVSVTDASGFHVASRTSPTSNKLYKNGSVLVSNAADWGVTTAADIMLFMFAATTNGTSVVAGTYSYRESAFASVGAGLNDAEVADLNTIVQAFNTTLSRNV